MAQHPRKGMDHPDVKAMQTQREYRAKETEAAMRRMESTQPTPTQEENDLAKIGIMVDEKQDDGSGPTIITRTVVANEPLPVGGYEALPEEKAEKVEKARREHRERTHRTTGEHA